MNRWRGVQVTDTIPVLRLSGVSISAIHNKGRHNRSLVHGVDLSVYPGEMIGLVGESGSGKSVTAAAVLGLLPKPLHVTSGHIYLEGMKLCSLSERERRRVRGKRIAYMFQNYQGSFTPFMKIGKQLVETIRSHEQAGVKEARETAMEWLNRVQLPAARVFASYPFQLSGGQLQRASLAAALMLKPSLLIADEPTTALDVLTGEGVLELIADLRKDTNCAVLLISHDLNHVLKHTDRMAVMYGGRLIEEGATKDVRMNPQHPYTQLLLKARPVLTAARMPGKLAAIPGEPGSVAEQGCPFGNRCPSRTQQCAETPPEMKKIREGHVAACHLNHEEGGGRDEKQEAAGDERHRQIVLV
ncbi:ABC transporter ATP-binding protein [Paenibacillus sp. sptzw28]|uniref:ABC transporter ATP-binding protein n=1 Tax=Paenibacillus sp. sptzw28 TaxID=715179 RepID=UPI0021625C8B|nr:ABC transporter ATP-binding protein [Paenibacillus sp. sptzw28]